MGRRLLLQGLTDLTTDGDPNDAVAQPPKAKFGKQQIIGTIITLVVLVLVFVIVLPQFGDYSAAWAAIQNMTAIQISWIVASTIGLILFYVFPYTAAMPELAYRPGFKTRQTSFMISNVIPAGGAFGLAVQFAMLSSYGYKATPTTATIGITGVWNTLVTLSLPLVAIILLAVTGQNSTGDTAAVIFAAFLVVVMIGGFALILRHESFARRIGGWGNAIIRWGAGLFKKDVSFDAVDAIVEFRAGIIDVVKDRWLLITFANVGQQLIQFAILYFAVVALQGGVDGPISPVECLAAFSIGRLTTFIPIPPGGLGTTDAIINGMLTSFGMNNNDALAATLVWRAATYFPQVFIGLITFLMWRREQSKKALAA